jgi:uncharacterized C2H2 Zn-finger protein
MDSVKYQCSKCDKIFKQKSHYTKHVFKRKTSCIGTVQLSPSQSPSPNPPNPPETGYRYKCPNCTKTFTRKDNLSRHIVKYCTKIEILQKNTVLIVDVIHDNTPAIKTPHNGFINVNEDNICDNPLKSPPYFEEGGLCVLNLLKSSKKKKKHFCGYCNKQYSRKDNLTRHQKDVCKYKKEKELKDIYDILLQQKKDMDKIKADNEEIKAENKELKNQMMKIDNPEYQHINTNINNTINKTINNNNTINNNTINIVAFGKEEITFTDEAIMCLLSKGFNAVELTVKNTNFSTKKPHFHNVYLPNIRGDFAMVYNGFKWGLKDLNYVLQQLYNDKKYYLEDKFDEFIGSLSKTSIKSFRRFLKKEERDPNCSKGIMKNIKAMMHNDRTIPLNTKLYNDNIYQLKN